MGETFVDSWQDQVPSRRNKFALGDVNNTKWEGNSYEYINDAEEDDPNGDLLLRFKIWSRDPNKVRLDGEIHVMLPGVEIHLRTFSGNWKAPLGTEYVPSLEWDNFDTAFAETEKKFHQVVKEATVLSLMLTGDTKWEGKY